MKKLTLSVLAILFVFSLSTVFVSCGEEEKTDTETTGEVTENDVKEENNSEEAVADYSAGKEIYTSKCQACHQENGEGIDGSFPRLDEGACDINVVVNGVEGTAMLAFKDQLTNKEIADLVNYINHAWENNYNSVTAEDIAAVK